MLLRRASAATLRLQCMDSFCPLRYPCLPLPEQKLYTRGLLVSSDPLIQKLTVLNQIAETLNGAADVRTVLDGALAQLLEVMGLQTGWIFLKQPSAQDAWYGRGYTLAA